MWVLELKAHHDTLEGPVGLVFGLVDPAWVDSLPLVLVLRGQLGTLLQHLHTVLHLPQVLILAWVGPPLKQGVCVSKYYNDWDKSISIMPIYLEFHQSSWCFDNSFDSAFDVCKWVECMLDQNPNHHISQPEIEIVFYHWLCSHATFDITCFLACGRAKDVISSIPSTI